MTRTSFGIIIVVTVALLSSAGCKMPVAGSGSLTGRVTMLSTGQPMKGVAVVYGDSAVYTGDDGTYLYEGIPDGLQGVSFVMDGYYKVMQQVTIPDGGTAACDAQLDIMVTGWAAGGEESGYGTVLRTSDAGRTWVRQGNTSMIPAVRLTDVCAVDDMTCWIAGEADTVSLRTVLLHTADGGQTWTNQGNSVSGLPPVSIAAVIAQNSDTAWAAVSDTCMIIKTTNGGSSWSVCRESQAVVSYSALTRAASGEIWACGQSSAGGVAVEYSPDGGRTWSEYEVGAAYALQVPTDICAVSPSSLYLTGTNAMGVLFSSDKGRSWRSVQSDGAGLLSMDVCGDGQVWVCGENGTMYISADGFSTSRRLSPADMYPGGVITSVSFLRDGQRGAFSVVSSTGATGSVLYSTDGGVNWSESSLPFEFSLESLDFVGGSN
ncbi:MAG TPA: carboxypeptidase regulatory-like domain-containing protein [Candidatus Coprenecus pullistercoris]|nr:carboxypeptidase regulatory-like domain-containing protein [Candidatus Coprenecus pullistercoris]